MLRQQDRGCPPANCRPCFLGGKAGTAIRSLCLTQKLRLWQPLYLKISNGFPLVFAARRNAAPAFWAAKRGTTMVAFGNHCTLKYPMGFRWFSPPGEMPPLLFGRQSGNRNSQPLLNAKAADSYLCGRKAWPQLCFAKTGRNLALTTIVSQKNGFGNRLGRENAFLSQIAKKTSCEKKRLSVLFSANPAVSNSNIIQWFLSNYFLRYFFKSILSFLTKKPKNVIMPSECSGRPCSRQP